jgi:hypothetical protein
MTFILGTESVFPYLIEHQLWQHPDQPPVHIATCSSKNFNLVVSFPNNVHFLVKQERFQHGKTPRGEFKDEWKIQEFILNFPDLSVLKPLFSEVVHYDPDNAILVLKFLPDYYDLSDCYDQIQAYPEVIGRAIAQALATIHKATYRQETHRQFLTPESAAAQTTLPNFLQQFDRLKPEIFGEYCQDGIEFFRILQRQENLYRTIQLLPQQWVPCCLVHKDFRFYNILIQKATNETSEGLCNPAPTDLPETPSIKIIDWEKFTWGDPCYDVATIIASYLSLWIGTLAINPGIAIETALRAASIPLEVLQPTLVAIAHTYSQTFPEILADRPNFWEFVMQLAGFYLIERLAYRLEGHANFDNKGICTLQIAKRLICDPRLSFSSIFGIKIESFSVRPIEKSV